VGDFAGKRCSQQFWLRTGMVFAPEIESVPCCLLQIQPTPPHWHPALITAHEPIMVVTMPRVAQNFNTVINEMIHGTDFYLAQLLHRTNANLTHEDPNTGSDELDTQWNIDHVLYDTITSSAKPSSNGSLPYCSWSFGIFDESHQYKMKHYVGWSLTTNVRIGFKLQVTATPGFHSLYDWWYQKMWLL
jgi:hypothetical protein